ncbi:SMC-Scp complex subunit ScpB [Corynebacterium sp. 13CS0277]|uniref:SMC-Scp complex subunit ScpB n=1 Tax=Corynebacterium sp. 13CS0277 TaxID=2071994 RepID=UPI000D031BDA|nr:SMC-Scp complex subunit ScpB [Corynebacterium sp. 13CS0277]PRQ12105.1 SMC-Scp complex subunit ScpB [Corynebacterium sp. 13CS0277]
MVSRLRSRIESVLLVTDSPVTVAALARATDAPEATVRGVLVDIAREFDERGSGFELSENAEGWRLYTRRANADAVERLLLGGSHTKLTRAALETLAVVAYRQPVTRAQVAAIRGVNVDGVMRTLMLRGLVKEVETDSSTGAHLYATTELFLELLDIPDLSVLPNLAPLLPEVDAIDDVL